MKIWERDHMLVPLLVYTVPRLKMLKALFQESKRTSSILHFWMIACETAGHEIATVARRLQTLWFVQTFLNAVGRAREKKIIVLLVAQIITTLISILSNLLAGRLDKLLPESTFWIFLLLAFMIALLIGDLMLQMRRLLNASSSHMFGRLKLPYSMSRIWL